MAYALGVVLFALGILVSILLHEAGHMGTAKLFGMKVTQYFAGFGPTIWSFRRGETEYGVKAIPAGGFVKIIGMTPLEDEADVAPEDKHRVFWRRPLWQRTVVLTAGSVTHFLLGFLILWITAGFVGVANPAYAEAADEAPKSTRVGVQSCVVLAPQERECRPSDPRSPAMRGGLRDGDLITSINGRSVGDFEDLVKVIRETPPGPVPLSYVRDNERHDITVELVAVQRKLSEDAKQPSRVSALGVFPYVNPAIPTTVTYGPVESVGVAGEYIGQMFIGTFQALAKFPEKVPKLFTALMGEERDEETPISVVGASRLGGEIVEREIWPMFFLLLAVLNLFVGVFNLFPLLPLDGGHIAIAWFERVRSWFYARLGKPDPGRVDYMKLMPLTYAVIIVFGLFTLLTVAADIVNPIRLPR
ncbi:MAG TPA: site-2 protease family protein [Micromonosporaceae bacterium]